HAPAGYFVTNQFRGKLFPASNVGHLLGHNAFAGVVHLGEIAVGLFGPAACDPLRPRQGNTVSVAGSAIRGSHGKLVLFAYLSEDYTPQCAVTIRTQDLRRRERGGVPQ